MVQGTLKTVVPYSWGWMAPASGLPASGIALTPPVADPAGQVMQCAAPDGNHRSACTWMSLFGSSPAALLVTKAAGADPTTDNCVKWLAGGGVGDAGAACGTGSAQSVHTMSWFFPGTPATGVQNLRLTFPDGAVTNFAILDMRVTVNTVSASSSTFNIQRCVVAAVACSATQNTWVDIYSTVLTLAASNYTVAKGSAPDQNVGSLVVGDKFRASLVTIGASLADVTVEMTYKHDLK
jgi:hypothetical protein